MDMIKALRSEQWQNIGHVPLFLKIKACQEAVKCLLQTSLNKGFTLGLWLPRG
jgi:hypothetical protein